MSVPALTWMYFCTSRGNNLLFTSDRVPVVLSHLVFSFCFYELDLFAISSPLEALIDAPLGPKRA